MTKKRQPTIEHVARQVLGEAAVVVRRPDGWTAGVVLNPKAPGPPWPVETRYVANSLEALMKRLQRAAR